MGHFYTFIMAVVILTFLGALIDSAVFVADDVGIYLAGAALIACITVGLSYRYLDVPLTHALVFGLVFFMVNMIAWLGMEDWFWNKVSGVGMFAVFMAIFFFVLAIESIRFHNLDNEDTGTEDNTEENIKGDVVTSLKRWTARNHMMLETLLFSVILLLLIVYASTDPFFYVN
jgi:phosphate/sulfate permease